MSSWERASGSAITTMFMSDTAELLPGTFGTKIFSGWSTGSSFSDSISVEIQAPRANSADPWAWMGNEDFISHPRPFSFPHFLLAGYTTGMSRTPSLEIDYPSSDGKPMAESDLHRDWMVRIIELLKSHFAGQKVYVSGNLLIYYVEGDPKKCVAPDAFVVKDCDPKRRKIYKLWEESKTPSFVLETTSSTTRGEDQRGKMRLYARLQVVEYF